MRFVPVLILSLGAAVSAFAQSPSDPADAQASPKARALLAYFQGLSTNTTRHILSGQFTQFGGGANLRMITQIHDTNGHWPAIVGADYADFGSASLSTNRPDRTLMDYWSQGGIVTLSAHLYNPANRRDYGLRDPNADLHDLLAPGPTRDQWLGEMDKVAAGLNDLQNAGVVVLWRPFHEMNGAWFWWGAKDPDTFIKVWRQMFDYFTETKKLHNLLWVYAPNHGKNTAKYYPGDRYVDLVGLDVYTDFIDPDHVHGYPEMAALPKPFGFTEYGPHGASNPPGDYDFRRFLDGLEKSFPKTSFFMCWNGNWSLARNANVKELLDDPAIINRENLPGGLTGK